MERQEPTDPAQHSKMAEQEKGSTETRGDGPGGEKKKKTLPPSLMASVLTPESMPTYVCIHTHKEPEVGSMFVQPSSGLLLFPGL